MSVEKLATWLQSYVVAKFLFATTALLAYAFNHVVDGIWLKTVGNFNQRNRYIFKAKCLVARFTVKMDVTANGVVQFFGTNFIFQRAAAIFNCMNQIVLHKERNDSENAGFVHR